MNNITLHIYNSLTFQKEEFQPINPQEVLMYVCGPTVYDSPHLGHAKSAVVFDLVQRYLKYKGFGLKVVKNYTDIDDKIIQRANERKIEFSALTNQYIEEYETIMDILNVQKEDINPRATEVVGFIIRLIQELIRKEHAYEENGSVYFSVKSFPKYKEIFQNKKPKNEEEEDEEDLQHEQDESFENDKRDKRDFALWRAWKEGEPFWESPWGRGRPGWHIECSAMVINYLGETIDIHGGGQDLKFPHHRNELVQAEAFTGKQFANYFMHNGFVNINDEKMSKSLGNFFLVSDVMKEFDPMVVRFFLLTSHYRKSINYSQKTMTSARKNYDKIINTIRNVIELVPVVNGNEDSETFIQKISYTKSRILEALDDDFNTPLAFAEISSFIREVNRRIIEGKSDISDKFKEEFLKFFKSMNDIFGIFPNLETMIKGNITGSSDDKDRIIKNLLDILESARMKLRERKMFDISDEIRERLNEMGIKLEDK
ncbi:MAG: cysteine--tRNA ligase [Promethearchaeota archaeon]